MKINSLLLVFCTISITAQNVYRTKSIDPSIKTLQVLSIDNKLGLPVFELSSNQNFQISFDQLSHQVHAYSYTVKHCNADWTISNINTSEYLSGFTTGSITDSRLSVNTTVPYTHYNLSLPNENLGFKISGNYVVIIYEDSNVDKPIAYACFSLVDPKVNVVGSVRGNTDLELNASVQQLDFEVFLQGYKVLDPATEIKVVVRQNNRIDNEVKGLTPTFLSESKLSFINNKELIFEGGSEFHRFDISSVYAAGEGVSEIRFVPNYYQANLYPNKIQERRTYIQDMDVNGKFVVNVQNLEDDDTEADYMFVNFTIPTPQPFFDGQLYIGGEFNNNALNEFVRMNYDANKSAYQSSLFLKQGGYNYQYWFAKKGERKATTSKIDGSYWQTSNEYTVYVYHRVWGERYDRLVGFKVL